MSDYAIWPVKVWADVMPVVADLSSAQIQALGCMVSFADNVTLEFFLTAERLADRMGIKLRTAQKHIESAVKAGWLVRVRGGNSSRATDYRLDYGRCRAMSDDTREWASAHVAKVGVRLNVSASQDDVVPVPQRESLGVPVEVADADLADETTSQNDAVSTSRDDVVTTSQDDVPTNSLTNSSTNYGDGSSILCHCGVLMDNDVAENLGECWQCFYAGDEDDDAA